MRESSVLSYDERLALKARIDAAVRERNARAVAREKEPMDVFGEGLCDAGCGEAAAKTKTGRFKRYCSKRCSNIAFRSRAPECSVDDCYKKADAGKVCAMHYSRMRTHGTYERAA